MRYDVIVTSFRRHPREVRVFIGLVLLVVGIAALLASLGVVDPEALGAWWPLILIVWGLWIIVARLRGHRRGFYIDW